APGVHMNDIQLGIETAGHAGGAGDQVLRCGVGTDADRDALTDRPVFLNVFRSHVVFQAAVHLFGDLPECEFAQSDEIAAAEEIVQRLLHFGGQVDIPAAHAVLQGFGREVDHDGFRGGHGHPVRNRFTDGDAGDVADNRRNAFNVLDVES